MVLFCMAHLGECIWRSCWRVVHVSRWPWSGQEHLQCLRPQCNDEKNVQPAGCEFTLFTHLPISCFIFGPADIFPSFLTCGCCPDCEPTDEDETAAPLPHSRDEETWRKSLIREINCNRWRRVQREDGWMENPAERGARLWCFSWYETFLLRSNLQADLVLTEWIIKHLCSFFKDISTSKSLFVSEHPYVHRKFLLWRPAATHNLQFSLSDLLTPASDVRSLDRSLVGNDESHFPWFQVVLPVETGEAVPLNWMINLCHSVHKRNARLVEVLHSFVFYLLGQGVKKKVSGPPDRLTGYSCTASLVRMIRIGFGSCHLLRRIIEEARGIVFWTSFAPRCSAARPVRRGVCAVVVRQCNVSVCTPCHFRLFAPFLVNSRRIQNEVSKSHP